MAKQNKVYLPKDEEDNLFWVAQSREGLVVSLSDFGYKNMHLTFFLKEIEKDKMLFNIHITEEGENKRYPFSIRFEFDRKEVESNISKKMQAIVPNLTALVESIRKKTIRKPRGVFCLRCFYWENFNFQNMSNRQSATRVLKEIKTIKKDIRNYKLTTSCEKEKHNIYFNLGNDKRYIKMPFGFIAWKDWELFQNGLIKLFETEFKEELSFLELTINKIKNRLGELKR